MPAPALATRPARAEPAPPQPRRPEAPPKPLDLDRLAAGWQRSLDAAQAAVTSAGRLLPADEHDRRLRELAQERIQLAALLRGLGRDAHARPAPWLSPTPVTTRLLGLGPEVKACLFDLDGVLTDSGVLHALVWAEIFDQFLLEASHKAGRHFIPFDPDEDYRLYLDGRPRLEGIHSFLASRGIRLPEGRPGDTARAETAYGLARHKSEALERGLIRRGVTARPGAHRFLVAAGYAGCRRAVVSASTSTLPMLELAGLASLVEERADADLIVAGSLRSRPAPDLLLAACHRLGVRPEETVTFTHSPAGVAAGHTAGMAVVGVGGPARRELLCGFGAERVVPSLRELLDPQVAYEAA